MKKLIILLTFILSFSIACKNKEKTNNKKENNSTAQFKINPELEKPYNPVNLRKIENLNVKNAVYIYIQHLKEELVWNKRINYMLAKQKFNNKSTGNPQDSDQDSQQSYQNNFNQTFIKYKEEYEKIFFKQIGISGKKWEKFTEKYYKEILKYRQNNPDIEKQISKYSSLLQNQQNMLNNR